MAVLQPPTPAEIRDELEETVIRDLLGPAGDPEEEVEDAPRDRYLVGMLAPRRQLLAPEAFDDLAVGGEGTAEEGSVDINAPQATTMFPSSFGMTFCVDGSTPALQLTARWGRYERVESAVLKNEAGNPKREGKPRPLEGLSAP